MKFQLTVNVKYYQKDRNYNKSFIYLFLLPDTFVIFNINSELKSSSMNHKSPFLAKYLFTLDIPVVVYKKHETDI